MIDMGRGNPAHVWHSWNGCSIRFHDRCRGIPAGSIFVEVEHCVSLLLLCVFFFSSRRRHTRSDRDWSSDVCSSDLRRLRCAAHILNLAVTKGISVVDESIKKAREFASHIRRSQPCFEELKKIFVMKNKPFLVPDLDVETRWNSMYLMLEKLSRIREMTDILVVSKPSLRPLYPTDPEWKQIESIMALLKPIYEATRLLSSSSYPTIGDLRTAFFVITALLTEAQGDTNQTTARVAQKINEKLSEYWDELQSYFYETVLLDPSTKFTTFTSDADKYRARRAICTTYKVYAPSTEDTNQQTLRLPSTSARDYFRRQIKRTYDNMTTGDTVLDEYLNTADEDGDVLTYWKSKSSNLRWAPLVQIARDYLVAQATSVASEQIFSVARHTISATCNRLDAEKARASLCLKTWYDSGLIKRNVGNQIDL